MTHSLEYLKTANSVVRTLLMVATVGLVSTGSWFAYRAYNAPVIELAEKDAQLAAARDKLASAETAVNNARSQLATAEQKITEHVAKIEQQTQELADQERKIQQLDTAIALLKIDHRLARITVVNQEKDGIDGKLTTTIEFVELNDEGQPIDQPRTFKIRGDLVYVDYLVAKFDDHFVEEANLDRSTSICLFRRIFGEFQEPKDGFVLDQVNSRPKAYGRDGKMTDFERKIWDNFWEIANNPQRAKELGIRAAHGEAVSTKVRPGKTYRLLLRASGGLTITPAEDAPPAAKPAT